MVALFFVPKHLVMCMVCQTNTGHPASNLDNESNTKNKFTFKQGRTQGGGVGVKTPLELDILP